MIYSDNVVIYPLNLTFNSEIFTARYSGISKQLHIWDILDTDYIAKLVLMELPCFEDLLIWEGTKRILNPFHSASLPLKNVTKYDVFLTASRSSFNFAL